eukprot:gene10039-11064_t
MSSEQANVRTYKSKIYSGNALLVKDDFDEKLEKCVGVLNNLISDLSEREVHDTLNQQVCKSMKEHEEISFGLFYLILTEPNNAAKSYRDLSYISRDGFSIILNKLIHIINDKFARLLETPKNQVLWLIAEMMKNSVTGIDNVVLALLKQIAGGDVGPINIWLAENALKVLQNQRSWLDKNPTVLQTALYTYLRIIEDHEGQPFRSLRQSEVQFCISLLREKFSDCMAIGRDLVRLLHNNTRIPEFTALWKDITHRPQSLSAQFTGLEQILSIRTPRKILANRLTQEMENKITFLALKVRFGQQKRYQDWFYKQYLAAPESQSLFPDLVRFLCGVIHPPNEVLGSDIIPRWAILGWLYTSCQNPVAQANVKLAIFYDWLFYSGDKDNIMNIEPAMLLMHNSIKTHPMITYGLLEFICKLMSHYSSQFDSIVKQGVKRAFRSILEKRVVSSLGPLFNNHRMEKSVKILVRESLPEFIAKDKSTTNSKSEELPSSPTSPTPPSVILPPKTEPIQVIQPPAPDIKPQEPEDVDMELPAAVEEVTELESSDAVFSDEDEEHEPKDTSVQEEEEEHEPKSAFKPIIAIDDDFEERIDEGLGGDDVTDLDEFQNIDNNLLRDNILKLRNDNDDSIRCEAMESIISTVDSMKEFDDEMATPICVCLAACLIDDLATPCLPADDEERQSEEQQEKPQHVLFRSITSLSKHDIDRDKLYVLLNGLHELDQKVGYHFLYFLKDIINDGEYFNYEDYISYQKDKTFKTVLISDMTMCHQYDLKLFLHLFTSIFQVFSDSVVGNPEVVKLVCSAISPIEIRKIITQIAMGELSIIGENQVESLLVSSLSWDSFEQNSLWQILMVEETPIEMVVGVLPHLTPDDHPEALSALLIQLRQESPIADVIKPLLCMPCSSTPGIFQLSTCLFKYWYQSEGRELAHIIAQTLTKLVNQSAKRRQGRGSSRFQPKIENVLSHLDLYRKACFQPKEKGLFKFESLRSAIEQVKVSNTDSKMKSKFQKLFDDCLVPGERSSRKEALGRLVTRTSLRRKPKSESSDESSSDEDDNEDDDDDDNGNDVDDSEIEMLPSYRSPSRKRRRKVRQVDDSDED